MPKTEIQQIKEANRIVRNQKSYNPKQIAKAKAYLNLKIEQYATTNINEIISQIN